MEKKRKNAMEMAKEANAPKKESNEAKNTVSKREYGVTRYPNGLQLGDDSIRVY